jgi:hypothetical protein
MCKEKHMLTPTLELQKNNHDIAFLANTASEEMRFTLNQEEIKRLHIILGHCLEKNQGAPKNFRFPLRLSYCG